MQKVVATTVKVAEVVVIEEKSFCFTHMDVGVPEKSEQSRLLEVPDWLELYNIIIVIDTPKGFVVPVVGDAEKMNFVEIKKMINGLAKKATDGTISMDEMVGGSLTISNSGVYGIPRPLMYIALTYDHRLIDGRKVVFLIRHIKDAIALVDSHGNVVMKGLIDKVVQLKEVKFLGYNRLTLRSSTQKKG
ncbi:hypothetical protein V6N12_062505 [Hibiscus sabdariffa]|uniref:dihydrolipoyllysine-residue succinyltransferase n=1 Tax=Hibiscus sabdariffa TaxID=183260 RepID=A0ABR2F9A9_9ROSI